MLELMHTMVNPCHESVSAWAFRRQVSVMCAVQRTSCSMWLESVVWSVRICGQEGWQVISLFTVVVYMQKGSQREGLCPVLL